MPLYSSSIGETKTGKAGNVTSLLIEGCGFIGAHANKVVHIAVTSTYTMVDIIAVLISFYEPLFFGEDEGLKVSRKTAIASSRIS
jgi:hypothetical protein